MKRVFYTTNALKQLRQHANVAPRLKAAMEQYAGDVGAHANNVKRLQGSPSLRIRIGDFRVVFEETADEIIVTKLGPRGTIYD